MGIRPAESKRIHAGKQFSLIWQCRGRYGHRKPEFIKGNGGIDFLQVKVGRNLPMIHYQCGLDETRHPRSRFRMPDVRLDRPHQAVGMPVTPLPQYRTDGTCLDRIAHRRSGAMGFGIRDLPGADAGPVQRLSHQRHLGIATGHGQPLTVAIVVHGRRPYQGVDMVSVGNCAVCALQDDQAGTFSPHIAVCRGIERAGPSGGGQHPRTGFGHRITGREQRIDPTRHRHVRLTGKQARAGLVHGDQ